MVFECNIGARGKAARLKLGMTSLIAGLFLLGLYFVTGVQWGVLWLGPAAVIGGGAFAIFEARTGWCVIRAMGFKTPI